MIKLVGICIVIAGWKIASMFALPLFVPAPEQILSAFIGLIDTGQLGAGLIYSFGRITAAAFIALAVALPIALIVYWSDIIHDMMMPVVSMMRFIPVTAFSPLLILWFGIDEKMKISFLVLATFVYLLPSILLCFDEIPEQLINLGKTLGLKKHEVILKILLPAAAPSIANSFLMMYGIGWSYVAVVEAVNAKYGLGFIINVGAARGKTAIVFSVILTIMAFSFLFDLTGKFAIKRVFAWRYLSDSSE